MNISAQLKERFCTDCKIPIKIYQLPYFEQRMTLLDPFYGTREKWKLFLDVLNSGDFKNEQDYFEYYNNLKDQVICFIKNNEAYKTFNTMNMSSYMIKHKHLPTKEIYKASFIGRRFISIDIVKANFSALNQFDPNIFTVNGNVSKTWEEFLSNFTPYEYILKSKYIRQVVLGNCNPGRHITYEKYLMDQILSKVLEIVPINEVVFFSNDEIVIDITDKKEIPDLSVIKNVVDIPIRIEEFTLHFIPNCNVYYKEINANGKIEIDIKGANAETIPYAIRHLNHESIQDEDLYFMHNGKLAKFCE